MEGKEEEISQGANNAPKNIEEGANNARKFAKEIIKNLLTCILFLPICEVPEFAALFFSHTLNRLKYIFGEQAFNYNKTTKEKI